MSHKPKCHVHEIQVNLPRNKSPGIMEIAVIAFITRTNSVSTAVIHVIYIHIWVGVARPESRPFSTGVCFIAAWSRGKRFEQGCKSPITLTRFSSLVYRPLPLCAAQSSRAVQSIIKWFFNIMSCGHVTVWFNMRGVVFKEVIICHRFFLRPPNLMFIIDSDSVHHSMSNLFHFSLWFVITALIK